MENPFKFGSVVDKPHFTNRKEEIKSLTSILESHNHAVLISSRRYGKTSLILNVVKQFQRPVIYLDLQIISSITDFAGELLKRIYSNYPMQKIRSLIGKFRIIPTLNVNPVNGELSVNFQPAKSENIIIEDVFNLLESISNPSNKIIVVFDEFQEVKSISSNLDRRLRAIMQHHKNVNYVFLGSRESMMKEIFEHKKSPFYHFGYLITIQKIPYDDFMSYLSEGFKLLSESYADIAGQILEITDCHPYYTQQLAFTVWEKLRQGADSKDAVKPAIESLISTHDYDYERLWNNFNQTDKNILIHFSNSNESPLKDEIAKGMGLATSTLFSGLKRLCESGYLIRNLKSYEIDDPFFKLWIVKRRNMDWRSSE